GDRAAHQRVLQDTQVDAALARLLAQAGDRFHFQTTVLGVDDRLGLRHLGGDFLDDGLFRLSIESHGLSPEKGLRPDGGVTTPEFSATEKAFLEHQHDCHSNPCFGTAVCAGPSRVGTGRFEDLARPARPPVGWNLPPWPTTPRAVDLPAVFDNPPRITIRPEPGRGPRRPKVLCAGSDAG